MENEVSMTNLLLMGLRTYLSKMNDGEKDVTVRNYVSRRSTLLNKDLRAARAPTASRAGPSWSRRPNS